MMQHSIKVKRSKVNISERGHIRSLGGMHTKIFRVLCARMKHPLTPLILILFIETAIGKRQTDPNGLFKFFPHHSTFLGNNSFLECIRFACLDTKPWKFMDGEQY